jgi:hypothetical protein
MSLNSNNLKGGIAPERYKMNIAKKDFEFLKIPASKLKLHNIKGLKRIASRYYQNWIKLHNEKQEIYELLVGTSGDKKYTHSELCDLIHANNIKLSNNK